MFKAILLCTVITALLANPVFAQKIETVFYETQTELCTVTARAVPKWSVLDIHLSRKDTRQSCALTMEETGVLFTAVLKAHKKTNDPNTYTSMMIGHLENYSWIQDYLMETALSDANWSQTMGRPTKGLVNVYVNNVLSNRTVINVFNKAGEKLDYTFENVDCEKVFISNSNLPINAFCGIEIK